VQGPAGGKGGAITGRYRVDIQTALYACSNGRYLRFVQ
jgi:hypothetical protein